MPKKIKSARFKHDPIDSEPSPAVSTRKGTPTQSAFKHGPAATEDPARVLEPALGGIPTPLDSLAEDSPPAKPAPPSTPPPPQKVDPPPASPAAFVAAAEEEEEEELADWEKPQNFDQQAVPSKVPTARGVTNLRARLMSRGF